MGRKKKPTSLKLIEGTYRKDREVEQEPELEVIESIDLGVPSQLVRKAIEAWQYYAPILIASKILTQGDLHNLVIFCENYRLWEDAVEMYQAEGISVDTPGGGKKPHPAVRIAKDAASAVASFGASLGLDPSSRTKINVGKGDVKKGNPFGAI
ncbi:MAG: phage terminase small subunit P27 family [Gammaproteobacteria bacterium]|nr:phage terminase small subunit P27 family [Gammaproteobacteria bacterium]MBL4898610.1 phage terminase small subunit P27 family [Colwellia sp.]